MTENRKPWPLSWVLIVILLYITLQTAYFLFFTD
jgi:quinol-cytochrome oxidoreductase complex cytochrome b subunit